jgi:CHAD domain-containing protein
MAFQLRPQKSTAQELRRLARKELGSAREALVRTDPPREESVHSARKSVKKVRAILRLIESDDGRGLSDNAERLRAVNRTLSRLRDAAAMIETFDKLRHDHPELFSEHVYARVRRQLVTRKHALSRAAGGDGSWRKAARELRRLRKDAKHWRPAHDGFAVLAPGIRKTHRRARKALARATEHGAAADFHDWRKEVKALWYELRLVGGGTAAIARDIRALHSAEVWLGDDHNLVVLCAELSKDPSVCRSPLDIQRLRCAVDTSQRRLRRKAIARTRLIFSTRPPDYVRRVERAWNARQKAAKRPARRRAA